MYEEVEVRRSAAPDVESEKVFGEICPNMDDSDDTEWYDALIMEQRIMNEISKIDFTPATGKKLIEIA